MARFRYKVGCLIAVLNLHSKSLLANEKNDISIDAKLKVAPSYIKYKISDTALLNPENKLLNLPESIAALQAEPEAKLTQSRFYLVYRPLIKTARQNKKTQTSVDTYELFGEANVSDRATFLLGVKNDQWGPTESISPTNKIFRDTIIDKNPLYQAKGLYLSRLNILLPWNLSLSLLAEMGDSPTQSDEQKRDRIFRAGDEEFVPKGLARLEWSNSADYFSFLAGSTETGESWVGEYFNFRFFERLSFYGEARHERGSRAWYPKQANVAAPVNFAKAKAGETKVYTLAVGGLRYETDDQIDLRIEYIENNFGYTQEEKRLFEQALDYQNPRQVAAISQNFAAALRPGLELRGLRYGYASLRANDALWMKDLSLFARALMSLSDRSLHALAGFECALTDHAVLSGFATLQRGSGSDDLAGLIESSQGATVTYNF